MCGSILDHGKRKIRKPRRCWGCTKRFDVGAILNFVVSTDMGSAMTAYWCDECQSTDLKALGFDEYCMDFGDIALAKREQARYTEDEKNRL